MSMLLAILSQASVFIPLSIGIYISTAILHITDLAIDGSFLLGAATYTLLSLKHCNPLLSIMCAALTGSLIGLVSAVFQRNGNIQPIIAGMLAVFIAHGAFFLIMGGPNVSLYGGSTLATLLTGAPTWVQKLAPLGVSLIVAYSTFIILSSCLGLALRTFGSNPMLLTQLGKTPENLRLIGLALSNAAAGMSGALTAQQNGYADISMGFGVTLIGIATVLIGVHMLKTFTKAKTVTTSGALIGCFIGTFIYFFFNTLLLISGISPLYLKSVFALVLGACLYLTNWQAQST